MNWPKRINALYTFRPLAESNKFKVEFFGRNKTFGRKATTGRKQHFFYVSASGRIE
jgi:hypothetical protein